MNFTYNNHLKYFISNRQFGYRETGMEKYNVVLGSIDMAQYKSSNYVKELQRTADNVYGDFGKEMVVFLSGGTDSEIVVRNFLDIGIRPECAVIKFKDDYNLPDVIEAQAIATELDLKLNVIDFDVKEFYYSGEAKEFGNSLQCTQVTYLMVYYNILKLGRPAVMGGEALLTRGVSARGIEWYYTFRENEDASAMRFSLKYDLPLVNEWFSYTPELLLYYLEDSGIQDLISNRYNFKLTSVSSKNAILRRLYPNIRPKIKTHGFERLLGFNYEAYKGIGYNQIKRLESNLDGIPLQTTFDMLRGLHK